MEKQVYVELQYFKVINVVFSILMVINLLVYYLEWGDARKLMSLQSLIFAEFICIIIIALFYKMVIIFENNTLVVSFGIGLIKKTIKTNEIIKDSITIKKIPLYYGMGIRFTPYGLLYNTSPGDAVFFRIKGKNKKILIGTRNSKVLSKILSKEF